MALIENLYTGDGSTVLFSFTFPYLETSDINASIDGVDTTEYTLVNATTVQFNTAPAASSAVRIYRTTDVTEVAATFFPGSAIRAQDLNTNFEQQLYVVQEGSFNSGTAQTDAANAVTTANAAEAKADTALADAAAAQSAATQAQTDAILLQLALHHLHRLLLPRLGTDASAAAASAAQASTDAANAVTTADTAQTTADAALPKAGGTMTGSIAFASGQPGLGIKVSDSPPSPAVSGDSWWDSGTGQLYVYYQDADSAQWVAATPETVAPGDGAYIYPGGQVRTISDRLQDQVSVKDFGAVGDGVTDDTAAIQAALDNGGKVYLISNATHKVSAALDIDLSKTSLFGTGSVIDGSTSSTGVLNAFSTTSYADRIEKTGLTG